MLIKYMQAAPTEFQCYLVLGTMESSRKQTEEITKKFKININKISPDIFHIFPTKQSISIDDVRNLKKHIFQKPVEFSHKIIIIEEAHKLTIEAQNALLKILEEPPKNIIIILEAQNKEGLLPTIRSRVVIIDTKKDFKLANENYILSQNLRDLLNLLPEIKNPQTWLDNQILLAYIKISKDAKTNGSQKSLRQDIDVLEKCIAAKKMVNSNVNATFVLANLFFSTVNRE